MMVYDWTHISTLPTLTSRITYRSCVSRLLASHFFDPATVDQLLRLVLFIHQPCVILRCCVDIQQSVPLLRWECCCQSMSVQRGRCNRVSAATLPSRNGLTIRKDRIEKLKTAGTACTSPTGANSVQPQVVTPRASVQSQVPLTFNIKPQFVKSPGMRPKQ
jgi:hypothetical protein